MQANMLADQIRVFVATGRRYWLVATVTILATAFGAGTFALIRRPTWKASQGLIVRDQISERSMRGQFESLDAMKTAQETILEIARNRSVVERALKRVGPPPERTANTAWPNQDELNDALLAISISPPKGAEFGSTELIYLNVNAPSRERALEINRAVCDVLEGRLKEIRNEKANSIIAELEKSLTLSKQDLERSTRTLEQMERKVGDDLGELRMLNTQGSGESNLRSGSTEIKNELRRAEAISEEQRQMQAFLQLAVDDPTRILGAPKQLLATQPALRRLKDGLVDAQLRAAELSGTRSPDHPLMKAARIAESEVRLDLHRELHSAIRALNAEMEVNTKQVALLQAQLSDVTSRMGRLAGLRARYGNLVAEVRQRTSIVAEANRRLADARANQEASTSLLTRVDAPATGNRPEGPGKSTILAIGLAGGIAAALGLLLLLTPMSPPGQSWPQSLLGRRNFDQAPISPNRSPQSPAAGRRANDIPIVRRASDASSRPPASTPTAGHLPESIPSEPPHSAELQENDLSAAAEKLSAGTRQRASHQPPEQRETNPAERRPAEQRRSERRGDERRRRERRDDERQSDG